MNLQTGVSNMNKTSLKRRIFNLIPRHATNVIFKNKIRGNIKTVYNNAFLKNCVITCNGNNNQLILGKNVTLNNCEFFVAGDNNTIIIGDGCMLHRVNFWIEESGNEINLGEKTTVGKNTSFSAIEGTKILIGKDCMFSSNIDVRTGDSHTILQNGERINPSKDVVIGEHVWVGQKVLILKGSSLAKNSIVGAGALVTSSYNQEGCIIAGVPSKIIKENISWERERL